MPASIPVPNAAAADREWFAVYTTSRHENAVSQRLRRLEIEAFLPVYRAVRKWRNGCRTTLELPLFSNYLFVRIRRGERVRVLQMPGVVALVGSGAQPAPISDLEIETLREATRERQCEPHPYLTVGQRVRIYQGPLRGLVGILVRRKSAQQIVLNLDAIMQGVAIHIDTSEVEPLPAFLS